MFGRQGLDDAWHSVASRSSQISRVCKRLCLQINMDLQQRVTSEIAQYPLVASIHANQKKIRAQINTQEWRIAAFPQKYLSFTCNVSVTHRSPDRFTQYQWLSQSFHAQKNLPLTKSLCTGFVTFSLCRCIRSSSFLYMTKMMPLLISRTKGSIVSRALFIWFPPFSCSSPVFCHITTLSPFFFGSFPPAFKSSEISVN